MMMSEFIERTGFEPTYEEYAEIEEAYYHFSGNKDEFCKQFVEHDGAKKVCDGRVQKISQLKSKIVEMEKDFMHELQQKEQEIARLTDALEREQEWTPYESQCNVKQADYERLEKDCCTEDMPDTKAIELIANEFGFVADRIVILHEVAKYEINRHNQLRKIGTIERLPLYNATDWNYIRFNVRGYVTMSYEMYNGELKFFAD